MAPKKNTVAAAVATATTATTVATATVATPVKAAAAKKKVSKASPEALIAKYLETCINVIHTAAKSQFDENAGLKEIYSARSKAVAPVTKPAAPGTVSKAPVKTGVVDVKKDVGVLIWDYLKHVVGNCKHLGKHIYARIAKLVEEKKTTAEIVKTIAESDFLVSNDATNDETANFFFKFIEEFDGHDVMTMDFAKVPLDAVYAIKAMVREGTATEIVKKDDKQIAKFTPHQETSAVFLSDVAVLFLRCFAQKLFDMVFWIGKRQIEFNHAAYLFNNNISKSNISLTYLNQFESDYRKLCKKRHNQMKERKASAEKNKNLPNGSTTGEVVTELIEDIEEGSDEEDVAAANATEANENTEMESHVIEDITSN